MVDGKGYITAALIRVRQAASRWWGRGSIGFRVSFLMTAALIMVAALVGLFFLWEGRKTLGAETRNKALYMAQELTTDTADDIGKQDRLAIYKTFKLHITADKDTSAGRAVLYIIAYDQNCNLIIGSTATEIISPDTSFYYMLPVENEMIQDTPVVTCKPSMIHESILLITKSGVYDYTIPVKTALDMWGLYG